MMDSVVISDPAVVVSLAEVVVVDAEVVVVVVTTAEDAEVEEGGGGVGAADASKEFIDLKMCNVHFCFEGGEVKANNNRCE